MSGLACVFFHAHPDDEALYTAGTMARLAAEGHRVVLVVATAGERGLAADHYRAGSDGGLGRVRLDELATSARTLGAARVEFLGYADSGLDPEADPVPADDRHAPQRPIPFCRADLDDAAGRLASICDEERAAVLTTYDPNGGYGHPDHKRAHLVAYRAAAFAARRPAVLEATIDRDRLGSVMRLLARARAIPAEFDLGVVDSWYVPGREITHQIDVGRYVAAKRASLAAHTTQTTGGDSIRTVGGLLRLPGPAFKLALGTEWYVHRGRSTTGRRLRHPLAGLG